MTRKSPLRRREPLRRHVGQDGPTPSRKHPIQRFTIPDKRSKKLNVRLLAYKAKRSVFLLDSTCSANIVGTCTKVATEIHHKRGRGKNFFLDTTTWLAVCRPCHDWIEHHPVESKQLGFSESRLAKDPSV